MFKFSRVSAVAAVLFAVLAATSCQNKCEDIICEPCPSSKLMIRYEDNTGNCIPSFHATAGVYGLNASDATDTLYRYSLSDSCTAALLIQEDVIYHVVSTSPAFSQTVQILDYKFRPGIEVSECCLCYPLEHLNVLINGDSTHVEFPDSAYQNDPIVQIVQ